MNVVSVDAASGRGTRVGAVSTTHAIGDLAWAPDSTHLAVAGSSALVGDATVADSLVSFAASSAVTETISWSPDSAHVLVWGSTTGAEVASADGGSHSTIVSGDGALTRPVSSPDSASPSPRRRTRRPSAATDGTGRSSGSYR